MHPRYRQAKETKCDGTAAGRHSVLIVPLKLANFTPLEPAEEARRRFMEPFLGNTTNASKFFLDCSFGFRPGLEIKNLSKKLLTATVLDEVVRRINEKEITNSKDIRKLRQILRDPVAKNGFLDKGETIDVTLQKVAPDKPQKSDGLLGDIENLGNAIRQYPWTTLSELRGNRKLMEKIEDTEKLLKELKENLSK